MSDDSSKEDKTEDPSSKRLEEAWRTGDVPIGKDFAMVAGVGAGAFTLVSIAPELRDSLVKLVAASIEHLSTSRPLDLLPLMRTPALLILRFAITTALAAVAVTLYQTNGQIWIDKLMPDFGKVFSLGKIQGLISKETLKDIGISCVKLVAVAFILWAVFRDDFVALPGLLTASPGEQLAALFRPLADGLVKIVTVLGILAGIDLALVKSRFKEKLKMTKQEVKREHRDDEGDPAVKGKRKRRHREIIRNAFRKEVPKADALIVNPTHIAIAIRYRVGEDRAPRVIAKGKGQAAELMRDLAREHGIPIVENIALARLLFRKVKVGRTVPAETYKAVAAVLAFVYRVLRGAGAAPGASR